jgi:cell division protein FtsB
MSRNRKNQSMAVRFAPALKVALLCAFLGGAAIGYVWQKNQSIELDKSRHEKEDRLARLRQDNQFLTTQLRSLRGPAMLERRVKELGLHLVQPSQAQILRLVENPLGETKPRNDLLVAGRNTGPTPTAH